MYLTRQRTHPRDPNRFPTFQLFLLALVRVAEPISLTSVFPYAWQLVLTYNVGDRDHASFYAGILISAFSLAEALTGMYWGGLSDKIGRKPVLLIGCLGTLFSLIVVGFSQSFALALLGRLGGGLLNGNIGVIQTMVAELVTNPEHEPKAYAVMPFVWSIGTIIGPSIGGYFATPAENFPNTFSKDGIFGRYPFLLPNVICASLLSVSIFFGYFFLNETHPDMQPWSTQADLDNTTAETPLIAAQGSTMTAAADVRHESYGTFNAVETSEDENWHVKEDGRPSSITSAMDEKVFSRRVVMLIIALGIYTYHSMAYDHLLPIFFQDQRQSEISILTTASGSSALAGGLGLSIQQVGIIMSVNGLIALFVQAVIFPAMATWLGIWKLFMLTVIGHPIAYFIMPYLTLLPESLLYPGIYTSLTIRNFFTILTYPVILILLKESSPSRHCLGKINGLAASTGAACRCVSSPVAGLFYGLGMRMDFTALAWFVSGFIAVIGAVQAFWINRKKNTHATVHAAAPCRFVTSEGHGEQQGLQKRPAVVHIIIEETTSDPEQGYAEDDDEASMEQPLLRRV